MGFLSNMKMYMKVDGVTGDVVTPSSFLGCIEIRGLLWPGEPRLSTNSAILPAPDKGGVYRDYPDFPNKVVKDTEVSVSAIAGKHTTQIYRLVQTGISTTVDIWVPMPHGKLLKARLTNAVVSGYSTSTNSEGVSPEQITFNAESGKLRSAS